MKDKEYISLEKIIEYIERAKRYTKGYTFEMFTEDEKTRDATVFAISQIGELIKNISKSGKVKGTRDSGEYSQFKVTRKSKK